MAECDVCSTENFCQKCLNGLAVSDTGKCVDCNVPQCQKCEYNGICNACSGNFTLAADKSACYSCIISNCKSCTGGSDKCDGC